MQQREARELQEHQQKKRSAPYVSIEVSECFFESFFFCEQTWVRRVRCIKTRWRRGACGHHQARSLFEGRSIVASSPLSVSHFTHSIDSNPAAGAPAIAIRLGPTPRFLPLVASVDLPILIQFSLSSLSLVICPAANSSLRPAYLLDGPVWPAARPHLFVARILFFPSVRSSYDTSGSQKCADNQWPSFDSACLETRHPTRRPSQIAHAFHLRPVPYPSLPADLIFPPRCINVANINHPRQQPIATEARSPSAVNLGGPGDKKFLFHPVFDVVCSVLPRRELRE
jgi:hypothetical protein